MLTYPLTQWLAVDPYFAVRGLNNIFLPIDLLLYTYIIVAWSRVIQPDPDRSRLALGE